MVAEGTHRPPRGPDRVATRRGATVGAVGKRAHTGPDGIVVVDKPAGWTSHDVVGKLRRIYGTRRVGHAGTLDPMATGVLLVGIGRATRLLRFLQDTGKSYRGEVTFGVATDTLDAEGTVLEACDVALELDAVRAAAGTFVGEIDQVPPMVSALKVDGRKLYELARAGEEVERAARRITVARYDVTDWTPGPRPRATIEVDASSGTYVRVLALDLGAALGVPAHLSMLRRTAVGRFTLADARPVDAIEADPAAALRPIGAAVAALPAVALDEAGVVDVRHGRKVAAATGVAGPHALFDATGALIAVAEPRGGSLCPVIVLAPAS